MTFDEFERFAHEAWDEIPDAYRHGVDGLTVRADAPRHPDREEVFTLGECLTEEHVSDYGSADTTRSTIALYWGSFRALAERRDDFDWEEEIWETLTHELRHHLESLAGDDALGDVDRAADEGFRRQDGEAFDPWYYQRGEEEAPGVYRVERDWYVEVVWDERDRADEVRFRWGEGWWAVPWPEDPADVHFVYLHGVEVDGDGVELVLVRRRSWWGTVRRMLGLDPVSVAESEATAEPIEAAG